MLKAGELTLRAMKESDIDELFIYFSEPGVLEMAGRTAVKTRLETEEMLQHICESSECFIVEFEGKAIGYINIKKCKFNVFPEFEGKNCCELGFVLAKPFWGRGFMTAVVKEIIKYCFEELQKELIVCCHFIGNEQSARVQKKCGFQYHKNAFFPDGDEGFVEEIANVIYHN